MRTETLFSELLSAILYRSQCALRGTGDMHSFRHLFDSQQWIIMASCSSAHKKKKYDAISLKHLGGDPLVTISLWKLISKAKSLC